MFASAPLTDEALLREALREAAQGLAEGEIPIGCVIVDLQSRAIVARGHNRVRALGRKTAHAEMVTFESARLPEDRPLLLVSTLEPCVMCLGACMESAIAEVLYGLRAPPDAGTERVRPPQSPDTSVPRVRGGVLADESRALLTRFRDTYRGVADVRYVERLLAEVGEPHRGR